MFAKLEKAKISEVDLFDATKRKEINKTLDPIIQNLNIIHFLECQAI